MLHRHINRNKNLHAKLGLHWCRSCDLIKVGQYGKCPVCGKRANPKKRKIPLEEKMKKVLWLVLEECFVS